MLTTNLFNVNIIKQMGTAFKSQACVTFLSTWLTILSLFTNPLHLYFLLLGKCTLNISQIAGFLWWTSTNQELDRVTDGHF